MQQHGNVVFGGDGYSPEWHRIAVEERGLKNIPTTADALPALLEADVIELFKKTGVLTPVELASRYEVYAEQYILAIEVEAKLVVDMTKTLIYPAAMSYLSELSSAISGAREVGVELDATVVTKVAAETGAMMKAVEELSSLIGKHDFDTTEDHMKFCAGTIRSLMDEVREHADCLELEVSDELWPLPKYRELLFFR